MWLRNPFTKLSKDETEDLQICTYVYHGDPWSKKNLINTILLCEVKQQNNLLV